MYKIVKLCLKYIHIILKYSAVVIILNNSWTQVSTFSLILTINILFLYLSILNKICFFNR